LQHRQCRQHLAEGASRVSLDFLLDLVIGVTMLSAIGIMAWVWFRWDRLNGDRPPDKFEEPRK